ncbi:MAG: efflux RND transporter permease subunit, partial [Candidatus Binatia bacterium]
LMIKKQSVFFLGTVGAVLVVLFLAFGQIQGVVLPAATALLSTIWAMGMMGFMGIPVTSWTASVPLMVLTVAAGHSAQMLKRYYEEYRRVRDRRAAVVESTVRIGVVMMAAGFTAGCGFSALGILGIPTLTHFGLGVATGIFAAVILEMTFMLALRVVWPTGRATGGEGPLSGWLGAALVPLEVAVSEHPRRVVAAFALMALGAVAGYPRLTTELNPRVYWPEHTEIGRDLRVFDEHFPSTTTVTVLLEGEPGAMKSPEAIRTIRGLQETMAADPEMGRTSSVVDILQRTYEVFAPEEKGKPFPLEPSLIGQLFFLSESPAFERFLDRTYARAAVLGFLDTERSGVTRRVLDSLHRFLDEHPPKGIRVLVAGGAAPTILALNEHTVKGKILNIAIVLVVIFLIASVLLRTPLGGAYVVAPLVMALVVNLGSFAWLG